MFCKFGASFLSLFRRGGGGGVEAGGVSIKKNCGSRLKKGGGWRGRRLYSEVYPEELWQQVGGEGEGVSIQKNCDSRWRGGWEVEGEGVSIQKNCVSRFKEPMFRKRENNP